MIKLDVKNAIDNKSILKYAKKVANIAKNMDDLKVAGYEFLGWKDLPEIYNKQEVLKIKQEVKRLKSIRVNTLVVVGIGGSFAGAKAGIGMVNGFFSSKNAMEVIFAGESLSATDLVQKLHYLQDKNFAINIISKSGTTVEPALAFRALKKLLEEKVGVHNAKDYIIATTDANKGTLLKMSQKSGYTTFAIPDNIGGRFSVLTSVGLFPLACAGVDIDKVLKGALIAHKKYKVYDLNQNDAYKYAVTRYLLSKKWPVELMVQYEPQMAAFNEWWKQLTGESEGKNEKGVWPASAVFSTDLHSLGQFIQEGSKVLFETVLTVSMPNADIEITEEDDNLDNLNYLVDKTIHEINHVAFKATTSAHVSVGKVPNIHIEFYKMNEENFGELVIFFERAIAMTGYLRDVNPFNQPGVEVYKSNMFKILKKPVD